MTKRMDFIVTEKNLTFFSQCYKFLNYKKNDEIFSFDYHNDE